MILCVSVNPALDRCIVLERLTLGAVNRAISTESSPGGKAANVALAARALGSKVRFLGLLGGPTGQAVEHGLSLRGVEVEVVETAAATRINLELIDALGVTEVLEPGNPPTPHELTELLARCRRQFAESSPDTIVAFSGSLPAGVAPDFYAHLVQLARAQGLRVILDTSGQSLELALSAQPDFVKPNREEAEAILRRAIATPAEARQAVEELVLRGARAAIVSLGSAGLVGSSDGRAFLIAPPQIQAVSTVGCGDTLVAGLAVALERGYARAEQLIFAAACGAANCLAESPGSLDPNVLEDLRKRSILTELG